MKNQIRRFLTSVFCPAGRKQKAARYLQKVFEPALFQTVRAWLKAEKGWDRKVHALNSIVDGYFALAGPIEPEDLGALRLKVQRKIERKLDVSVWVTRSNPQVTFGTFPIELTDEDLHPKKEVAR